MEDFSQSSLSSQRAQSEAALTVILCHAPPVFYPQTEFVSVLEPFANDFIQTEYGEILAIFAALRVFARNQVAHQLDLKS
jgi:hypothetical protein